MKAVIGVAAVLAAFNGIAPAQSDVLELLRHKSDIITHTARGLKISPRLLASVVYAEQTENVKAGEKYLDVVFAHSGYNTSVGLAQIKVMTAKWIEQQLHDPQSQFYLGQETVHPRSRSYSELIDWLSTDSTNLLYASAYLAMIEKLWGETLSAPWLQNSRTGILATLYSLGIAKPDGSFRTPHNQPAMNQFGRTAQGFFDSFLLREEFSE